MRMRTAMAALALAVTTALLAGCVPDPTPTPSASGFADEDAAFAAAEATYRAYVDAGNRVDLSDPATFEDVYQWTTGDLNAADRESYSSMHAEGFTSSGESTISGFTPESYDQDGEPSVIAEVCWDISQVDVMNTAGISQVSPDRADVYQLRVEFFAAPTAEHGLLISNSTAVEADKCVL